MIRFMFSHTHAGSFSPVMRASSSGGLRAMAPGTVPTPGDMGRHATSGQQGSCSSRRAAPSPGTISSDYGAPVASSPFPAPTWPHANWRLRHLPCAMGGADKRQPYPSTAERGRQDGGVAGRSYGIHVLLQASTRRCRSMRPLRGLARAAMNADHCRAACVSLVTRALSVPSYALRSCAVAYRTEVARR